MYLIHITNAEITPQTQKFPNTTCTYVLMDKTNTVVNRGTALLTRGQVWQRRPESMDL